MVKAKACCLRKPRRRIDVLLACDRSISPRYRFLVPNTQKKPVSVKHMLLWILERQVVDRGLTLGVVNNLPCLALLRCVGSCFACNGIATNLFDSARFRRAHESEDVGSLVCCPALQSLWPCDAAQTGRTAIVTDCSTCLYLRGPLRNSQPITLARRLLQGRPARMKAKTSAGLLLAKAAVGLL